MHGFDQLETTGKLIFIFALGLTLGSFATALSHRIPAGIPWAFASRGRGADMPRSACPSCGNTLRTVDLVPLFSWLFLRGRCRYCRAPIGVAYPLTELATAVLCLIFYASWSQDWLKSYFLIATSPFLMALLLIDFRYFILPDILNLSVAIIWLCWLAAVGATDTERQWAPVLMNGMVGAMLYGAISWATGFIMRKILKKDALGLGDVKFFMVAGLWLGPFGLPVFLMAGGLFGVILGLIYKRFAHDAYFPFGPALIASFALCITLEGQGLLTLR